MKHFNLSTTVRRADQLGKRATKALRREKLVPVVLYEGSEIKYLVVKADNLNKLIYTPEIYLIGLDVEGRQHKAVLEDIQFHLIGDKTPRADLCEVSEEKPIVMRAPVTLGDHAIGVRAGGKLVREKRTLRIRATYDRIPENLVIDVSNLGLGKAIQVHKLSFEGLELVDASQAVACGAKLTRTAHGKGIADAVGDESEEHGDSEEQSNEQSLSSDARLSAHHLESYEESLQPFMRGCRLSFILGVLVGLTTPMFVGCMIPI